MMMLIIHTLIFMFTIYILYYGVKDIHNILNNEVMKKITAVIIFIEKNSSCISNMVMNICIGLICVFYMQKNLYNILWLLYSGGVFFYYRTKEYKNIWAELVSTAVTIIILSICYYSASPVQFTTYVPQQMGILYLLGTRFIIIGLMTLIEKKSDEKNMNRFYCILWFIFLVIYFIEKI